MGDAETIIDGVKPHDSVCIQRTFGTFSEVRQKSPSAQWPPTLM